MPMNPRLLRPLARFQAPQFDPASISGLNCWLDADDTSTLFENSDGTTPSSSGSPVGYWGDKSGQGFHATQSGSSTRKPSLSLGSTNGKPSVSFDNAALQRLEFSANPLAGSAAGTAFYVCRGTQGQGACIGHPLGRFGTSASADHYPCGGSDNYFRFGSSLRRQFSNNPPFTSTHVGVVISRSSDWRFWAKATLRHTATPNTVQWGSGPGIGGSPNETQEAFFYPGVVCEVLLYNSALSDADRTQVTDYLVAKWGIA